MDVTEVSSNLHLRNRGLQTIYIHFPKLSYMWTLAHLFFFLRTKYVNLLDVVIKCCCCSSQKVCIRNEIHRNNCKNICNRKHNILKVSWYPISIFASCYNRDIYFSRRLNFAIFFKIAKFAKISCYKVVFKSHTRKVECAYNGFFLKTGKWIWLDQKAVFHTLLIYQQ